MARLMGGAANDDIQIASAPSLPTVAPMTLYCRFKRTASGNVGYALTVSNGSASARVFALSAGVNLVTAQAYDNGPNGVSVATQIGDTGWHTLLGWFTSSISRLAFIDAAAGTVDTTSVSPSGVAQINVGCLNENFGSYLAATFQTAAGWDVVLTDAERLSLDAGFSPRRIRPQSLMFYMPLIRDVQELLSNPTFARTGGSVANHYRTYGL